MAYHLGISARGQDELTMQEWEEAVSAIKQIREETAKAAAH